MPAPASGCLLTDIGDFLVRVIEQVALLVHELVGGNHVRTYTSVKVQEMDDEHGFSELREFGYLEETHRSLKSVFSPPNHDPHVKKCSGPSRR